MACVRKRRGKYEADYREPSGRRRKRAFGTKREAEAFLVEALASIRSGKYVADDSRTVAEAYEHYLRLHVEGSQNRSRKPLRPTTRTLYEMTWRVHVEPRWAGWKLRDVHTGVVADWQQALEDAGTGPKTVINCMALLAAVFKHARLMRWTSVDPTTGISRPSYKVKVSAFTREQVQNLVATAEQMGDHDTALMIRTLALTGLRIGELFGLQWGDLDLTTLPPALHVRRQFTHGAWSDLKTDSARRTVPIAPDLATALQARLAALDGNVRRLSPADDRLVFPSKAGTPHDHTSWTRRRFAAVCRAAGIVGTPHMLRHSYATTLIQSKESAPTVAALLGHSTPSFTMNVYADAWPAAVSGAGEKVYELLFGGVGSRTVAITGREALPLPQVIDLAARPRNAEWRARLDSNQ